MTIPEGLSRLTLSLGGQPREVVLRHPTVAEIIPLAVDPEMRTQSLVELSLVLELQAVIDTLAGEVPTELDARAIVGSPEALARVLAARNALYHHLAEQGRALLRCPHCGEGEVTLDLLFYWMALRLPPWDFFDRGVVMHRPSLATLLPAGRRPEGAPVAGAIAFAYPGEPPVRGTLRPLETEAGRARVAAAWDRFVPALDERSEEQRHWRRNSVGFAAILRLAVALDPDPAAPSLSPEVVDRLPLGAFLFLDLLYFATHNVDVREPDRISVSCPRCARSFLPVAGGTV